MNPSDQAVYDRLLALALAKRHLGYEFVFQERRTERSPEWGKPVENTLTTLSDGSLAYVFDSSAAPRRKKKRKTT